jgi:hypothetical protein
MGCECSCFSLVAFAIVTIVFGACTKRADVGSLTQSAGTSREREDLAAALNELAKPGVHISEVVQKLGEPDDSNDFGGGTNLFLWELKPDRKSLITGFRVITRSNVILHAGTITIDERSFEFALNMYNTLQRVKQARRTTLTNQVDQTALNQEITFWFFDDSTPPEGRKITINEVSVRVQNDPTNRYMSFHLSLPTNRIAEWEALRVKHQTGSVAVAIGTNAIMFPATNFTGGSPIILNIPW